MSQNNNSLSPVDRFWRLMKPDRKEITNIYVYAIFNGLVLLSIPLGIQAIVNLIQVGQVSTSWIILVVFVVLGVVVSGVLQIFQMRITENLQQKIFTRAAFEFAYRIPRIKMEALYRHYAPELMNRFFDTITVQKGFSKILIDFSAAGMQVIFGLILLSLYHPFFILYSFILVLLVYAIFKLTAKPGLQTSLQESSYKYKVAHWLEELARTSTTFKMAGNTSLHLKNTDEQVGKYLNYRESHFRVLVQQYSMLIVFKAIVVAGILAIGGLLVMQQRMNIGQFVAAEIIILMVMASVEKLIVSLSVVYDVLTALEKIGQVTDLELENDDEDGLVDLKADDGISIELENVHFSYPESSEKILNGLNLFINAGEKVAITGPNGSGKSTLIQVISGLYTVQQGLISFNGIPAYNINSKTLSPLVGDSVSQEQLFEGTVAENISMGKECAAQENIQWAINSVGLAEFVKNLPKGHNTLLEPQGKRLSRSIIQKLLLARSIACRPKLLLLETSLEFFEVSERRKIIDFLTSPENDWTLIIVSDDEYLLKKVHKTIHLEKGTVK